MYTNLLVTLDGTPRSESVLSHAFGVAATMGASVTLLRVVDAVNADWSERGAIGRGQNSATPSPFAEQARVYLERIADQLRTGNNVRVRTLVKQGHPARQIVAAAQEIDADAIAMATHSRRGFNRVVFGSVAEQVLHETNLPVLLIRAA